MTPKIADRLRRVHNWSEEVRVGWAKKEFGHVRELVQDGLYKSEQEAVAALQAAAVPLAGRVFSREALRRALAPARLTEMLSGVEAVDAVVVVKQMLAKYGIDVGSAVPGRTPLLQLTAAIPRKIVPLDERQEHVVTISGEDHRPWARVYSTSERRRGIAQFSANKYLDVRAPEIYFFVLVSEGRVWMTLKSDLVLLEHEVSSLPREERTVSEAKHGVGVPSKETRGTLRLWFSREEVRDGYHPAMRIADATGRLLRYRTP